MRKKRFLGVLLQFLELNKCPQAFQPVDNIGGQHPTQAGKPVLPPKSVYFSRFKILFSISERICVIAT